MRGGGDRTPDDVRVLGIDPGTAVTGWGVVEGRPGAFRHLAHGTVAPPARTTLAAKLTCIHAALAAQCAAWRPDTLALEKSFVGRNVQSAFRLGEVRGVAMLAAAAAGVAVAEYSPAEEKGQVERAIARELALAGVLEADAADALALALCHLQTFRVRTLLAAAGRPGTAAARLR
jgi:crossover junction endodeoxyribonuclease RuvC